MFQILTFTEATLATVTSRPELHGDEKVPAVSLGLEMTLANTALDCIDPKIRHALYMAVEGQEQLPGVEPATPVLRCNSFDRHTLPTKYEGWTLQVDDGIDDTKPMTFGSVKVDKLSVEAKQGGSVVLRLRAGTSDLDKERSGFLGMHVGQPVWITLTAPEKKPDAIDASSSAKGLPPQPDATDLFAAGPGPGDQDADDEGGVDVTGSDVPWPFPQNGEGAAGSGTAPTEEPPEDPGVYSRSRARTARGRDKMKAALAAGAKANGAVQ